jgi:predicted Zn-dependent peptidase
MNHAEIRTFTLPGGLTLVVEPMADVQSAAFALMVPAGSVYERPGANGTAAVLADLVTRGAGNRDSRQLSTALDNLGVQRSESVGWNFISFGGATLAENLVPAMSLYADVLLRPHLPEEEFDAALAGVEQGLLAQEDDPQRKVLVELRRRCYDAPWGLPTDGDLADLARITREGVRDLYHRCFHPNGTILGVAGKVDAPEIRDTLTNLLGDWPHREPESVVRGSRGPRVGHLSQDSTQTHIGIACDAVPYGHEQYYAAWAAVSVLSGGSSSRLFKEVREQRGLCYSVYAAHNSLRTEGRILAYAGTTAERAQETLDVTLREIQRLGEQIGEDELDRCKARAKSSLIMQQESTTARAGSIARDWFHLERVVTLDEVHREIDALTVPRVLDYLREFPPRDFTVLSVGPEALRVES